MSGRAARDRTVHNPDGDSAPGYSHKRPAYTADQEQVQRPAGPVVPYAELHCHSNFSFLDGVNDPEELIEEAVRLGLDALAITDHDGFYAASRFAEAAAAYDLRTIYGAELSLDLTVPQNGVAAVADRIAVGRCLWYSREESLEKPSCPISSSANREPSGWRNWVCRFGGTSPTRR